MNAKTYEDALWALTKKGHTAHSDIGEWHVWAAPDLSIGARRETEDGDITLDNHVSTYLGAMRKSSPSTEDTQAQEAKAA